MRSTFMLIIFLFLAGDLLAAPPAPEYLYHWTSHKSLARTARAFKSSKKFPLKRITDMHLVVHTYPELIDYPALFTWSHPITGMALQGFEIYGNGEALIRMKIRKKPRILVLNTYGVHFTRDLPKTLDLTEVDLIYHDHKLGFREWIIVNPDIVTEFTADPDVLKEVIRKGIEQLKDNNFKFRPKDLHAGAGFLFLYPPHRKQFVIPRLKKFLQSREKIPAVLRGQILLEQVSGNIFCSSLFAN